jgi:CHAT domain-containing protein/Flp pilus assembly protein TadD
MAAEPLYLTVRRHGDMITMDLAEVAPVVPRSQTPIEEQLLTEINEELARITALANKATAIQASDATHRADLSRYSTAALQRLGGLIFSHLFPIPTRRRLAEVGPADLFLRLDDQLVHVPWELAFDGQDFLCSKFRIGRQVISLQPPPFQRPEGDRRGDRVRMLIIVDPTETLPSAVEEADCIGELLEAYDNLDLSVIGGRQLRKIDVLQALSDCDLVHFAGHAVFDPRQPQSAGWVLHDGMVTAAEISRVEHPPVLVFSNACQAGLTTPWQPNAVYQGQAFGIGSAFLLAGTQNYIGTFCVIYDADSAAFAVDFYRQVLQGRAIGAALEVARASARRYVERPNLLWASYVHYGNPTFRLTPTTARHTPTPGFRLESRSTAPEENTSAADQQLPAPSSETAPCQVPEQPQSGSEEEPTVTRDRSPASKRRLSLGDHGSRGTLGSWVWRNRLTLSMAALALLVAGSYLLVGDRFWIRMGGERAELATAFHALERGDWRQAETLFRRLVEGADPRVLGQVHAGLAGVAFARRDYRQALEAAGLAEKFDPDIAYSHVIRGHILWSQGKAAEAAAEYRIALAKPHALPWQQALAHDRLGRLHALTNNAHSALEHYDQAIALRQDMAVVYANKAHALEQLGQPQEALVLYRRALQLDPHDPLTAVLLRQAEQRQQLTQDGERQRRIDQLVADLIQAYREGGKFEPPQDEWTSPPVTLAFIGFSHEGLLFGRPGEESFLPHRIVEALQASGRVTVVDRAVQDKLLAELKLSATALVDRASALRIGHILAARVMAEGRFVQRGEAGYVDVRLIDTETTEIIGVAPRLIDRLEDLDAAVRELARTVVEHLRARFPIQGRLSGVHGQEVVLNIGRRQGVTPGLVMQVFGEDATMDPIGRIEVFSVEAQRSRARVLEHRMDFQPGWKVREEQAQ